MSIIHRVSFEQELKCPRCQRVMTIHSRINTADYMCANYICDINLYYQLSCTDIYILKCISMTVDLNHIHLFVQTNEIKMSIGNDNYTIQAESIDLTKWLVSNEKLLKLLETYSVFS